MRPENERQRLFELNREIINFIQELIDGSNDDRYDSWRKPSNWNSVIEYLTDVVNYYEGNADIEGIAEVQIGLSKFLDFYSTDWMLDVSREAVENLNNLVTEIVLLAARIIQPGAGGFGYTACSRHEDGACVIGQLSNRFLINQDLTCNGWPNLPCKDAGAFEIAPAPNLLNTGIKLLRVVSLTNSPYGCWWIPYYLPTSKRQWRSDYAVLQKWSQNNYYVEFTLKYDLPVWVGPAASQRVPKENCILRGGADQIWLDPSDLRKMNVNLVSMPTPANF